MQKLKTPAITLFVLLWMSGCSGSGIDFAPESVRTLKVRTTTREHVVQLFGKAESSKKVLDGNTSSTIEVYRYSKGSGFGDTWKYKDLILEYIDDTLNGYLYSNSVDKKSTEIDVEGIDKLTLHQTTREEIVATFGKNYGEVVFPTNLIEENTPSQQSTDSTHLVHSALLYRYVYYERGRANRVTTHYRTLMLYFNAEGVLIDRFYSDNIPQ